jgi:hypothetical protein
VARLPQGWFLNTPVLWLAALLLEAAIRVFAQRAWLRDETISSCCYYSDSYWLANLACLGSCAENQQVVSRFYRDLDLVLGAHTNRLGRLGN